MDSYHKQELEDSKLTNSVRIGQRVFSVKGNRFTKEIICGKVIKKTKWREYPAAVIQKDNGQKVTCLIKNLRKQL